MIDKILGVLAYASEIKVRYDDDSVDRLNRTYTTFFLVMFALLVSTRQYVGEPISCWVPAQFTHNHEDYANKVCWVSNTYYLPFRQKYIPEDDEPRTKIGYYQWIPMILLCQATLFYIPAMLWRVASRRSGLNVKTVLDTCASSQRGTSYESREQCIRFAVSYLSSYLGARPPISDGCWQRIKLSLSRKIFFICGRVYGNYLTLIYLGMKFAYIVNSVGQLFLLSYFLGINYHTFGATVMISILKGEEWVSPSRFPRVTLCDFEVRTLGNIHRHTVQCVLPINLFNEKIFVFIWFWFVFVATVTIVSWLQWFARSVHCSAQVKYVLNQLKAIDKVTRETETTVIKFVHEHLRQDGVFIAHLIGKNTGELTSAEVLAGLWDNYIKLHRIVVETPSHMVKITDPILA